MALEDSKMNRNDIESFNRAVESLRQYSCIYGQWNKSYHG